VKFIDEHEAPGWNSSCLAARAGTSSPPRSHVYRRSRGPAAKVRYDDAAAIAESDGPFLGGEIDSVYVLYNEFKSVVSQKLTIERVLPRACLRARTPRLHL
jgi:F-type H+-transporting ATPase subunit gamma